MPAIKSLWRWPAMPRGSKAAPRSICSTSTVRQCSANPNLRHSSERAAMGAALVQSQAKSPRPKVGNEKAMATAKEAQHDAAESLFGAIIAVLDKHEAEHTLT